MKTAKSLAERIRYRREDLGLSREDLAAICDISVVAVGKWESGESKNLKHDHLFDVADALNVSARWLATGEGELDPLPSKEAYSVALKRRDRCATVRQRSAWERVAMNFAKAATLILFIATQQFSPDASAATLHNTFAQAHSFTKYLKGIHIVEELLRRIKSFIVRVFTYWPQFRTAG